MFFFSSSQVVIQFFSNFKQSHKSMEQLTAIDQVQVKTKITFLSNQVTNTRYALQVTYQAVKR